jgi:hypothetical protein
MLERFMSVPPEHLESHLAEPSHIYGHHAAVADRVQHLPADPEPDVYRVTSLSHKSAVEIVGRRVNLAPRFMKFALLELAQNHPEIVRFLSDARISNFDPRPITEDGADEPPTIIGVRPGSARLPRLA